MRGVWGERAGAIVLAGALATVALLVAAQAAFPAVAAVLPVPPGFRLRASNGYVVSVFGGQNPHTGEQGVIVMADGPGAAVSYATRAVHLGEGSIEADLGPVGRIDVRYAPTGKVETERSKCSGKPVSFEAGSYVGTIDFAGERGYSQVHASSAMGDVQVLLDILCPQPWSEGTGGHSPGARLDAGPGGPGGFGFEARANSPSRPAHFTASIQEKHGELGISRSVSATEPPATFSFDVPAGRAEVKPTAPFSGAASFRRYRRGVTSWRGNLRADFPGRPNVRLTGPGIHASLIRAVLNPGHPFRPQIPTFVP